MENSEKPTVPIAPATAAEPIADSAEPATGPKTMPADGTNSPTELPRVSPTGPPTSSPTAAEETLTPEPTTTTTRTLPGAEPMAIIPTESGPPPQYHEHEKDAITTPAPAVTLPQTNEKALPIAPQVPVSQRAIPLAQLAWLPSAAVSSAAFAAHFYLTVWRCVTIRTISVHTVVHKSLFIPMKARYSNSDRIYPDQLLKHQDEFSRRSQL
ncbi:hypothetical protein N7519_008644 [Penicillium mononematosum]|uniref:uncharacterized protein n=1 Tax=Penicillium mononematosum TaxID=268346 RepID=UPI002549ABE1|nr:uncharacterized protein N7519_008644 [Penicillium mononematosum]KAJ6178183.1 hypothetical protein N7519_008644 [Penicillium mononematosum]